MTAVSWPTSLSGRLELRPRTAWLAAGTIALILALGTLRVTGGSSDLVRVLQASLVVVYTVLVWTDLRAAMAILMLEIVLGGASGHWTTIAGPVSGRVTLEVLLMLRVAVVLVRDRSRMQLLGRYGLHALAVAFLLPAIWMTLGVARGNTLSNVFGDGNGIALFSLAIAFELLLRDGWGAWIRGWFFVCCVANAVVTGALVLASRVGIVSLASLSHVLVDKLALGNVVGYMPNGAYRLYLANSLFLPIVIAFTSYKLLSRPRSPWLWALFALAWADVIATYTRGVWVSTVVVFVAVLVVGARRASDAVPFLGGAAALFITAIVIGQASSRSLIDYVFTRTSSITQVTPTGSKGPRYPKALANRSFERGVRPWTATGGSQASVTSSDPFHGLRSLRLTESNGATDAYVAQIVGVRPRTRYLVTAHYRPIGVTKLVAPPRGLLVWDIQGGQVVRAGIVPRPGWRGIAVAIRTSPATHGLQVRLYAQRPAIQWDAVSVRRLSAGAPLPAGAVAGPVVRLAPTVLPARGGSSSSDTAGAASNAIKLKQAKVLLHHIEHSPVFGYGFGTIASDYPYGHTYSYELSYLDIAYKTGIVGLLLFLSFPLRLLVDAVRVRLRRLEPADGVVPYDAALVVVMIGTVLVTAVGNPVIEASYGVLPIVATVAWLDGDVRRRPKPPAEEPVVR
jgi:O-Antigen ligase